MSKSILPDGYLPAEFLETSQWGQGIYTNHRSINGQTVEIKGRLTQNGAIFGQRNRTTGRNYILDFALDNANGAFFRATSGTRLVQYWNNTTGFFTAHDRVYFYDDTKYLLTVDGNVADKSYYQAWPYADAPLALFGKNLINEDLTSYIESNSGTRVFYCKISAADGTPEANYVPAIDAYGVPCMFDKATQQPFYNVGSGSFIAGISTEQAYALIDKLPVLATNSNFALTISLPYTAQYDTRLVDALNTTIDLYKLNLNVTYSDADTTRALSIKEAYELPNILPKLTEETAATLAIILPYRAKYDTELLSNLAGLAETLYWTITITYASPVYPEDFHPAEFIDSDGTAYLDIPIATDCTDKAIKVRTQHLFDAASSGVTYGEGISSGTNVTTLNWSRVNTLFGGFAGNSSVTLQNPTLYTDKYNTIELEVADNATKLAINGRTATATHTDSTELPEVISQIGVFHTYGSAALLPGKKRFWQLTLDDKVFYNLVPALTWEGAPCMVNTLTNEFYTTAGSADFTIGLSEEQAYTVLPILLTTATTLPSIILPYCARANKKIQALLSEFETTDWVSYSDPVYPDDCIAITSIMQDGTLVDTSINIPCIMIGSPWTNTISIYDLNLKAFRAAIPEYVAVISIEELRAIINRLENYISIATANTSFSVQLPYSAQFDTELQTEIAEFTAQNGYGIDVTYANAIAHKDYIPATYLESDGESTIIVKSPEGRYNRYTGVRTQLATVNNDTYNSLFDASNNTTISYSFGRVTDANKWQFRYINAIDTASTAEKDVTTTMALNYRESNSLNVIEDYTTPLPTPNSSTFIRPYLFELFDHKQSYLTPASLSKLRARRILFSNERHTNQDLQPGITIAGVPCFVDTINNKIYEAPGYKVGMSVSQLKKLNRLSEVESGSLSIQLRDGAVIDAEAEAAIADATANGWDVAVDIDINIALPDGYLPAEFLESTGTQWIDTGYIPDADWGIEVRATVALNRYWAYMFGTQNTTPGTRCYIGGTDRFCAGWGYDNYLMPYGSPSSITNAFIRLNYKNSGVFEVDGNTISIPRLDFTPLYHVFLFAISFRGNYVTDTTRPTKLYSCRFSHGDAIIRQYVPALSSTGEPCMFDKMTKQPFYNIGTGAFRIGMTAEQAKNLANLPDTGGTLTVVLLEDSINEDNVVVNPDVIKALYAAQAKGWTFTLKNEAGETVTLLSQGITPTEFLEKVNIENVTHLMALAETVGTAPSTSENILTLTLPISILKEALAESAFIILKDKGWEVMISEWIGLAGYKVADYLQSTGTQYINTGLRSTGDLKIYLDVEAIAWNWTNYVFGYADSSTGGLVLSLNYNGGYGTAGLLRYGLFSSYCSPNTHKLNTRYFYILDKNIVYRNGTLAKFLQEPYSLVQQEFTSAANSLLILFGAGYDKTAVSSHGAKRIYKFAIERNGKMLLNYLPAIDSEGNPCMYDAATDTAFYNAGSGNFIVGKTFHTVDETAWLADLPVITTGIKLIVSIPDAIKGDLTVSANIRPVIENGWNIVAVEDQTVSYSEYALPIALDNVLGADTYTIAQEDDVLIVRISLDSTAAQIDAAQQLLADLLPLTATELQYENGMSADCIPALFLESAGAQYINIDYSLHPDSFAEIDVQQTLFPSGTFKCGLLGGDTSTNYFAIWASWWKEGYQRFDYNGNQVNTELSIYVGDRAIFKKVAYQNFINGENCKNNKIPTETPTWEVRNVALFSAAQSSDYALYGRIYSAKIGRADVIGRDFIPTIDKNGKPCMYDKVSKTSFVNANTNVNAADFVVGMTVEQARKLSKLPEDATTKTLTVSLPASIVDGEIITDTEVQAARAQAEAKGWVITIQTYTES